MKQDLNKSGITEDEKKGIQQNITDIEKQIEDLKAVSSENYDYKADLNNRITKMDEQISSTANEDDKKGLLLEKERLQKQLELGISPKDENKLNAYIYLNDLFSILGAIFLAAGIAIFSSDIVSGEYTPATMADCTLEEVKELLNNINDILSLK